MPTPQLMEHLRRLRRDAGALVPCRHPECAAYGLNLLEQIGIVVRLMGKAEKTEKLKPAIHGSRMGFAPPVNMISGLT